MVMAVRNGMGRGGGGLEDRLVGRWVVWSVGLLLLGSWEAVQPRSLQSVSLLSVEWIPAWGIWGMGGVCFFFLVFVCTGYGWVRCRRRNFEVQRGK
jgi:hypothetical protein